MGKIIFAIVLTLMLTCNVNANEGIVVEGADGEITWLDVEGLGKIQFHSIIKVMGAKDMSLDDFALSVGPLMREWSDESNFEACGIIASDGEKYGMIIGTINSHISCVSSVYIVPDEMEHINETIHTHGTDRSFKVNGVDIKILGEVIGGRSFGANTRRPIQTMSGQSLNEFSDVDFDAGPGYLAGSGGVLIHQNGKNNIRRIR